MKLKVGTSVDIEIGPAAVRLALLTICLVAVAVVAVVYG